MDANMVVRNIRGFHAALVKADAARRKVGETAVRVEAYRLKGVLAKELRQGKPGGRVLAPLQVISRMGGRSRKPLAGLAKAVRYWYGSQPGGKVFSLGFNGGAVVGQSGGIRSGNQLSKSWVNIATVQQDGHSFAMKPGSSRRKAWIRLGAELAKQGKRNAKYFFLKKSTKYFTVPKRQIIEPFWSAHKHDADRNIVSNFNRKMRGERI
jgi:hypothetical protein